MDNDTIHVLLVEDNPDDAELVRDALSGTSTTSYDVGHVQSLAEAMDKLENDGADVILLDLALPDSEGLQTVTRMVEQAPGTPVIILTGYDDDAVSIKAVQMGAQDYLVKNKVDTDLISRSIRYALERHRLREELTRLREAEKAERENDSYRRLADFMHTPVTAESMGMAPLRNSAADSFERFIESYGKVLDKAEEMRIYKVEHDLSQPLKDIAEELAFLRASPRDVIDVHTETLKRRSKEMNQQRYSVYVDEGRLVVLELMGYLTALYRRYSLGARMTFEPNNQESASKGSGA
jgi:DNA-binding response OmpR family regulator